MIKSMTGFGKSQVELPGKAITIEIKSLNSKQLDTNTRLPNMYKEKDLEIRNMLAKRLGRGKIDFTLLIEHTGDATNFKINKDLAMHYYEELKELNKRLDNESSPEFISLLVRMPDVLKPEKEELLEEEWKLIVDAINNALDKIDSFRVDEGSALEIDFKYRIKVILDMLVEIEKMEKTRMDTVRDRIKSSLNQISDKVNIDGNRFEQELIYYMEKLDVTEEKVRLKKHCEYFIDTLNSEEGQGKKLGFISQEIGREINTLGAKANEADMQKFIVQMKDELEKIKEQLLNIL